MADYEVFWFRGGGQPRRYSFWAADSLLAFHKIHPHRDRLVDLLDDLIDNYAAWEESSLEPDGLFWRVDDRDGMEVAIGGTGRRPTINSYQYGDARAIAAIARLAGKTELADVYDAKADRLRKLVLAKLWDEEAEFFKVRPRMKDGTDPPVRDVREQLGYTPWYFHLPPAGKGYEVAWKQLMDPQGFYAPFGPTTAERRHPGFTISYENHECQWNGPSWPMSTSVTLTALANVLTDYPQNDISKEDYFKTLMIYANSHRLKREDGKVVPWIDENLNPLTGDWISRTRLKSWQDGTWSAGKGGVERGKDYNHSTFCDLIITGLIGLRPQLDDTLVVHPLVPTDRWDWFCLDSVPYKNRMVTILWDRTGEKYGKGTGLRVFVDGRQVAHAPTLQRLSVELAE